MVKEVELRKLNGEDQYVDWETGEELFKKSECIPIEYIKMLKREAMKNIKKKEIGTGDMTALLDEIDFYTKLLSVYKDYPNGK